MATLEHETDQIINNLTVEQIKGLDDIMDFRSSLLEALGKFEITEEERMVTKRLQSMKRDNMKWKAISGALNPTMLLTGGPKMGAQLAFQVVLTAARTAVEYKSMQGELDMEELKAMWELREEDMKHINSLREEAQRIVFKLYNKYNLQEYDRLTLATATNFNTYTSEPDPYKRSRLLEDHRETYKKFAPYYYHLGMSYIDLGQIDKALSNFETYLTLYNRVPILRYDEKSGCIALAKLAYEKKLSNLQKEQLIKMALQNLPSNSAAVLQCVMVYLYDLKDNQKAFQLLRQGIDDPKATDKDILMMAAANLIPRMSQYPKLKKEICEAISKQTDIHLDTYLTYLINTKPNAMNDISKTIYFKDYDYWYQLWTNKNLNKCFHISLPDNITFNYDDIDIYVEKHDVNKLYITQLKKEFTNGIKLSKIEKINCFKNNPNLKYLFMDAIVPNELFMIKSTIDINKVATQDWPRMSEFTLSETDVKKIVSFLKEHKTTTNSVELDCSPISNKDTNIKVNPDLTVEFSGDSLSYQPHHSTKQEGYYLRIVLSNGINVLYKLDNGELKPFMYTTTANAVFANSEYQQEYEYLDKPENKDKEVEDKTNEKEEKKSILKKAKDYGKKVWHKVF